MSLRFINPTSMHKPPGYTHVVEATAPGRVVYIAGQLGIDLGGKMGGDFRAQAMQAFENLKAALAEVGGRFEHVMKFNMYFTDIAAQLPIAREVRDKYVNTAAPPASTAVQISKLARDGALFEIEAVAFVPHERS
jgi:enamine deaminase RidA (YjgF/YER057c/UK114 family)